MASKLREAIKSSVKWHLNIKNSKNGSSYVFHYDKAVDEILDAVIKALPDTRTPVGYKYKKQFIQILREAKENKS